MNTGTNTKPSQKDKAVFLDRDGTIIHDRGHISRCEQISLIPGTIRALQNLQTEYRLFVITNQSGISKGLVTMEEVSFIHSQLDIQLKSHGVQIEEWYVYPHTAEDNCECIKPSPFFIRKAAKDHGICPGKSFTVGDHPHDSYTGSQEGVFGLYVLTGHGPRHLDELRQDVPVFYSIKEASNWILDNPGGHTDIDTSINTAARVIQSGGVASFPTETVYGLGADAMNTKAVRRIFQIKKRPFEDPLIVHIHDREGLTELVSSIPSKAEDLMDAFWPGPLTIVFPRNKVIDDIVTAGMPTIAIRMPGHPWALSLLKKSRAPVAAPSANLFGRTSPTTAVHVRQQLGNTVEAVVDTGACRIGIESTVISLVNDKPVILRAGGISRAAIEQIIGPVELTAASTEGNKPAPGLLESHYAPVTPLYLVDNPEEYLRDPHTGILVYNETSLTTDNARIEVLTANNNMSEAAVKLYAAIRRLDANSNITRMVCKLAPDRGTGTAINDRLQKAATK